MTKNKVAKRTAIQKEDHIGMKAIHKSSSMEMKLIAYYGTHDVTVRFSDGTVVEHQDFSSFKKGFVKHPDVANRHNKRNERIGERRLMNNGQYATIISYANKKSLTVCFDDGTVVENRSYRSFAARHIANPAYTTKTVRIGERRLMNCGQYATIVDYNGSNSCTIRFDDGTVVQDRSYGSFKKGQILNPETERKVREQRIGERRLMRNGMYATIVDYKSSTDCTICFDDGFVREHAQYSSFKEGYMLNPNLPKTMDRKILELTQQRIGERRQMKNGTWATLIDYKNAKSCTIRFDDGTIVEGKSYGNFTRGSVSNPNMTDRQLRMGERRQMNNGMYAAIIEYQDSENLSVLFDDGTIVKNKDYYSFKKGQIANPNIPKGKKQIGTVLLNKIAYVHNGEYNFYCECPHCGLHDIMTVKEAREHVCPDTGTE